MVYTDIHLPLPAFIAIDWALMTLALLPILLRFALRRCRGQPHPHSLTTNISNGLVLLSWLSGIVLISINTWKNMLRERYIHDRNRSELYYGVPRPQAAHLLYLSWISLFFIYISLWAAKGAILVFYASLLRLQAAGMRVVLWAASAFAACTFALHMALLTRWCAPVSRNWDIDGHLCSAVHDIRSVAVSTAANIATDVVILVIPLAALGSLSRPPRLASPSRESSASDHPLVPQQQKQPESSPSAAGAWTSRARCRRGRVCAAVVAPRWPRLGRAESSGLAFVLAMGGLSITAAVTRFVTLWMVHRVPKADITHTIDVWALVEIVASLLAVCLPTLRMAVRQRRGARGASRPGVEIRDSSGSEGRSGSAVSAREWEEELLEEGGVEVMVEVELRDKKAGVAERETEEERRDRKGRLLVGLNRTVCWEHICKNKKKKKKEEEGKEKEEEEGKEKEEEKEKEEKKEKEIEKEEKKEKK